MHRNKAQTADVGSSYALDEDLKLLDILRKVRLGDLASRMGSGDERLGLSEKKDWSKVYVIFFLVMNIFI
jgi:ABC-type uncharacterized transport system fused permease/ATPase subunit